MIHLEGVSKSYLDQSLFSQVNISIKSGMRIGLIGPNGSGKTTFLKILLGQETYDIGNIKKEKNISIGYLPQEIIVGLDRSILQEVLTAFPEINKIQKKIEVLLKNLSNDSKNIDLINEIGELQNQFEVLGGWSIENKAKIILSGLGFSENEFKRHMDTFSGGWRMRVALASILLKDPDIIFLDEPTNHLDLDATIWLENFLKSWKGGMVVISHDREFLDQSVNYIFEINFKKIIKYHGNYSEYKKEKTLRMRQHKNAYKNQQKMIKDNERFIERFRYKNTKASQVQSRIKMLDKLDKIEQPDIDNNSVNLIIPNLERSPLKLIQLKNAVKNYTKINVFEKLNIVIERNQKIGLVGYNGAGKSTFLKILAGVENLTSGKIKIGEGVTIAYYAQNQLDILKINDTVFESIIRVSSKLNESELRTYLGGFLFSGEDIEKKVKVLSGGEKARLALARIVIQPSSLLLLDEPTNHLDMRSRQILERALKNFNGSIVCISHDRHFLNSVTSITYEVGKGGIRIYEGNYQYYVWKNLNASDQNILGGSIKIPNHKNNNNYVEKKKIRNRLNQINKRFKELDKKINTARAVLNNPNNSDNYILLEESIDKIKMLEDEYLELLDEKESLKKKNKIL